MPRLRKPVQVRIARRKTVRAMPCGSKPPERCSQAREAASSKATHIMSTPGTLGEQVAYEDLVVAILDEGQGTYRIQIMDGEGGLSSTCAGYTPAGIRERALELAYSYLLKRDGAAPKPPEALMWRPLAFAAAAQGGNFEQFAHPTLGRCSRRFPHCSLEKTRGLT